MKPLVLAALLLALASVGPGLAEAKAPNLKPVEVRVGGNLTDARRVSFAALAGLERRGYRVDRSLLRVRVTYPGHECWGWEGCATVNRYDGRRTIWWSRNRVRHAVVIVNGKRRPTCQSWDHATHELLHHAIDLRPEGGRDYTGRAFMVRDFYDDHEWDAAHALVYRLAELYTDEAARNGRCVETAA